MFDVALSKAGALVAMATSCDENFPPENILDGKSETFWMTTGLFPQEFTVSFASEMSINTVQIFCHNVKKLVLYRSSHNEPVDFEKVSEKELESSEGHLQTEEFTLSKMTAFHLRFVIASGYDYFVSIHKLHVDGHAIH